MNYDWNNIEFTKVHQYEDESGVYTTEIYQADLNENVTIMQFRTSKTGTGEFVSETVTQVHDGSLEIPEIRRFDTPQSENNAQTS